MQETKHNDYAESEGISHINMRNTSNSQVGQLLAMEAPNRFNHPVFGSFDSLEAFWFYIRSGCQESGVRFRDDGYGRRLFSSKTKVTEKISNFQDIIGEGLWHMLNQMPNDKLKLVLDNKLPLDIYHVIESKDDNGEVVYVVVQQLRHAHWYVPLVEKVIDMVRDDRLYPVVDYGDLPNRAR